MHENERALEVAYVRAAHSVLASDTMSGVPDRVRKDARLCLSALVEDLTDTDVLTKRGIAYSPYLVWDGPQSKTLDCTRRPSAILVFARPKAPAADAQTDATPDEGYMLLYDVSALDSAAAERAALRVPYKPVRPVNTLRSHLSSQRQPRAQRCLR